MNFKQWLERELELQERGARTALSANYPSLYHSKRQNPPNDWTPTSAGVPVAIKNGLGDEKPDSEFNGDVERKGKKKKGKKGSLNITSKKENPYKSFYQTEGVEDLRKKFYAKLAAERGMSVEEYLRDKAEWEAELARRAEEYKKQHPQRDAPSLSLGGWMPSPRDLGNR
jgi:hypothetical protein